MQSCINLRDKLSTKHKRKKKKEKKKEKRKKQAKMLKGHQLVR